MYMEIEPQINKISIDAVYDHYLRIGSFCRWPIARVLGQEGYHVSLNLQHTSYDMESLASATRTVVFYESPYRVEKLLEELSNRIADRSLVICRELTKRYEQVVRGTVAEVRSVLGDRKPRGEYVFVVEESRGKVDSP